MSDFQDKLLSGYYSEMNDEFWSDLDKETIRLQNENRKFDIEFEKNIKLYQKAKSLEKTNPKESIILYESIKNTNYGRFDTLDRLVLLYGRTKQLDNEIKNLEFLIEEEHNSSYDKMVFLQNKFPEDSEHIRFCYDSKEVYVTPELMHIDFYKKINRLLIKLNKLNKKK